MTKPATILDIAIDATHDVLRQRLQEASSATHTASGVRDNVRATDVFLASTSRHLAAVHAVLVPQARRHLSDGRELAHGFVHAARQLEIALNLVKGRLYGASYAARRPWPDVWAAVAEPFDTALACERELLRQLDERLDPEAADDLAIRLYHSELHAPSRPHPFLPHQGVAGSVARGVAARVDGFWDTAEGRMVPEPVHPAHRTNSLFEEYLLADPQFEEEEG